MSILSTLALALLWAMAVVFAAASLWLVITIIRERRERARLAKMLAALDPLGLGVNEPRTTQPRKRVF